MNFIEEFKKGQRGSNKGLYMGDGVVHLHRATGGIHQGMIYAIGAGPKVGKSTLADNATVIEPWLDAMKNNIPIEFIYFSYEIDRISKEFDFMAHFLWRDYGIEYINLENGQTVDGRGTISLSSSYLRGRMQDDNGETIAVKESLMEPIKETYSRRIIPLFGEYSVDGTMIKRGVIQFYTNRENPTGIRNTLIDHASKNGQFLYHEFKNNEGKKKKQMVGYKPYVEEKFTIVITDHLRKLGTERGFQTKQNVDKFVEYTVELRNLCSYTFIHIIHLNRNMSESSRMRYAGDILYPTGDDFKDTGNLSEEADHVLTMMNPNDTKYNLQKHFGADIRDKKTGDELYPNMRTIHLVESRHVHFPQHFRVNMFGGIKKFEPLIID